jgi:hypothetical protein
MPISVFGGEMIKDLSHTITFEGDGEMAGTVLKSQINRAHSEEDVSTNSSYSKVVYGVLESFTRLPDNSSEGVFKEHFTCKKHKFTIPEHYLYSTGERLLINSMIVMSGTDSNAVILVLNENDEMCLVRNHL